MKTTAERKRKTGPVDIDAITKLENKLSNSNINKWIGLWAAGGGLVGLCFQQDPMTVGLLLGGGSVLAGISFDQAQSALCKLDSLYYLSFGKAYKLSRCDIFRAMYSGEASSQQSDADQTDQSAS